MSRKKQPDPNIVPGQIKAFGGRVLSELCTLVAVCRCQKTDVESLDAERAKLRELALALGNAADGEEATWTLFRARLRKVLAMYADELETMDPQKPGGTT